MLSLRRLAMLGLASVALCFCLATAAVAPLDPEADALLDGAAKNANADPSGVGHGGSGVAESDSGDAASGSDGSGKDPAPTAGAGFFVHGFVATLCVIIVSELGDKTFFIAAIMAMRHPRMTVFAGAISALSVMHALSAVFGYAITVVPRVYTFYISSFLFLVFGVKMLKEGWHMSAQEAQEEMEEVQEDLRKRELDGGDGAGLLDVEAGPSAKAETSLWSFVGRIFLQSFTMTFLAEWGDRSQLATIVLAAREDLAGVIVGGILGHSLCTGLAVLGGRMIAQRISVRTVTLVGGVVFILFAMTAFVIDPNET